MNVGEKLKQIRKEKNMTQKELALKIDVSPSTVTKYENNQLEPNLNILIKISELFKISIDDLLGIDISIKDNLNQNSVDSDTLIKNFIIHVIKTSNIDVNPDNINNTTKVLIYNLIYGLTKTVLNNLIINSNKGDNL